MTTQTSQHVWVTFVRDHQNANRRCCPLQEHASREEAITHAREHRCRYGTIRQHGGFDLVDMGQPGVEFPETPLQ